MNPLHKANLEALAQVEELVLSVQTTCEAENSVYSTSGVGRHVRHVLDHYREFRAGVKTGLIDYNQRDRHSEVERSARLALTMIADLKNWILSSTELEPAAVNVISEVSALETSNVIIESNVERELHYLAYHSIHHMAYCVLMAKQHGLEMSPSIGLAPGTATYQRSLRV